MLKSKFFVFVILQCVRVAISAPVTGTANPRPSMDDAKVYLTRFGYLQGIADDVFGIETGSLEDPVISAIKSFQFTHDLPVTGELDDATVALMATPRCGNTDENIAKTPGQRSKRFAIEDGGGWSKTSLTYRISKYPANSQTELATNQVNNIVSGAYQLWTNVTPLTIHPTTSGEDLTVLFASYSHGDGFRFDGPGGVLAHTFFPANSPPLNGDLHFDDSETWTYNAGYGSTDLLQVATHEFGHALGLAHSLNQAAVMYPYYTYKPTFGLTADDIKGIQSLYGSSPSIPSASTTTTQGSNSGSPNGQSSTTSSTITTTVRTANGSLCTTPTVDAAITVQGLNIILFQGAQYVLISGSTINPPQPISSLLTISTVDAAMYLPQLVARVQQCRWCPTKTVQVEAEAYYFFQGASYYKYTTGNLTETGSIQVKFQGLPPTIDASFTKADNAMYFTAGTQLYRITRGKSSYTVDSGYPVSWSNAYPGIPGPISAAFQYLSVDYFFTVTQYYRTSSSSNQVSYAYPPYPRDIATWWFDCPAPNNLQDVVGDSNTRENVPANDTSAAVAFLNNGATMSESQLAAFTGQSYDLINSATKWRLQWMTVVVPLLLTRWC